MSDPFGDDDIDFDVASFTNAAYSNAVAYLADERPITRMLPPDMESPIDDDDAPNANVRSWTCTRLGVHDEASIRAPPPAAAAEPKAQPPLPAACATAAASSAIAGPDHTKPATLPPPRRRAPPPEPTTERPTSRLLTLSPVTTNVFFQNRTSRRPLRDSLLAHQAHATSAAASALDA